MKNSRRFLAFVTLTLIVQSCGIISRPELNSFEQKMKVNELFPLDSTGINKNKIFRISYFENNPLDTCSCSVNDYLINNDNNILFKYYYVNGLLLFQKYKIYNYKRADTIIKSGFKYIIVDNNVVSEYYFEACNISKKIKELDTILLDEVLICK